MPKATLVALVCLAAAIASADRSVAQSRPPNFIIIFADDQGYGDLGSFGHPTIRTPHLDRMAAEGQRWTSFYSAASVCTPSRAGLLTARLPVRSGMTSDGPSVRRVLFPDSAGGLPGTEITIAEALKPRGYATAAIGKWHLGHLPQYLPMRHGFDSYFGIPYSNDMDWTGPAVPAERRQKTMNPKIEYWNVPLMRDDKIVERPAEQSSLTRRYTDEAIAFVRRNRERPFFLYLAHSMPHMPLFPSGEFEGKSLRGRYGDVIEELDWNVGRLLDTLRQLQLDRQTLVVFTSDNGPWAVYDQQGGSAGVLRGAKGGTFEGGMRVPAIFWWPGTIRGGVVTDIGSTLDLLPTFAAIAGAEAPRDRELDGFALDAALRGTGGSPRKTMIYYRGATVYAVRHASFKAHFFTKSEYGSDPVVPHQPPLLYNLDHDPAEKFDVANDHPAVVAEIERIAAAHKSTVKPVPSQLGQRISSAGAAVVAQAAPAQLPAKPLRYGAFTITFGADGAFALVGEGWPEFAGTWKAEIDEVTLVTTGGPTECAQPGRYRFRLEGSRLTMLLAADDCGPRRMILDRSAWRPEGESDPVTERRIVRTEADRPVKLSKPLSASGSWPSFRGPRASGVADGQHLPDRWDGKTRQNILWRTPIPGLAHSSPVVWGDRIFVTSAISGKPDATFKPGLYGDGDASDDRSRHKWMLYAIDKRTGKIAWERVAFDGEPREKRHVKSTYASSSPATDGRIVVAWFGSHGVHAYDVNGASLWTVDLGRVDMGAYDVPSYEWGPASSPIIWNGLVLLQCDTQADSFVVALDAQTGKTVWKTDRTELPSWGTPTVIETPGGAELVTNASNYIRGYDARTGRELWRLGGSSKITAPTPIFANGLIVVASGRRPERPIFAVRPGARGDLTLDKDKTSSDTIAWSKTARGSYMPTPLAYNGILYVLNNDGVFDAYDAQSGREIYRQRLPHLGSGFSASPIAADGRIYLSNEDGEMLVVAAGHEFRHIATNTMGELLMATPALSDGVMYVRSSSSLFAVGKGR